MLSLNDKFDVDRNIASAIALSAASTAEEFAENISEIELLSIEVRVRAGKIAEIEIREIKPANPWLGPPAPAKFLPYISYSARRFLSESTAYASLTSLNFVFIPFFFVGVVFLCELSKRSFYILLRGISRNAKYVVIIFHPFDRGRGLSVLWFLVYNRIHMWRAQWTVPEGIRKPLYVLAAVEQYEPS